MPRYRLPSVRALASELRQISANVECGSPPYHDACDVRLVAWSDGSWCIRSGPSDYDQSHGDYCGAASVPGVVRGRVVRFDSTAVARDLLAQVREQIAMDDLASSLGTVQIGGAP